MNSHGSVIAIIQALGVCLMAVCAWSDRARAEPAAARDMLKTDAFSIAIEQGYIKAIVDSRSGKDYLPAGHACPILSVQVDGKLVGPTHLDWTRKGTRFTLSYEPVGVTAEIAVAAEPTHLAFDLLSVAPKDKVQMVVWGPYTTTIGQNIGNMVGVVWDAQFAFGMQVLNPKTTGGCPGQTEIASAQGFGSSVAAQCRDKERPTEVKVYDYVYQVSHPGEGVAGSRIALFGCAPDHALDTIGRIELAEGLPHLLRDGQWVKALPGTPYLAFEFDEKSIEQFIKVARDAGIPFIYHPSPWQTWGHFRPKQSQFPNGMAGFKACVDKAHQAGLRVGAHTLSTFITADDAYVTPKPDPRLATAGVTHLTNGAGDAETVLEVAAVTPFGPANGKKCIRIGDELISYGNVVGDKPARLEGCARGAFGTTAQAHPVGSQVFRMILGDFMGPIFYGNRELNREIAQRGASNCNELGLDKYEFDGVEGTLTSGLEYSGAEFVQAWYDALAPANKGRVMLGGSGLDCYTNHVMDCVNWGEPWGDVFRKGMIDYRFMRLEQYKRNLLPHMLGQFAASVYATAGPSPPGQEKCRVEDIEWLMALRCGHDAGFSLTFTPDWEAYLRGKQGSPVAALMLPNIDDITASMHAWESAYQARAFPPQVKMLLQDRNREFHLIENGAASWTLYPIVVAPAAALDAGKRQVHVDNPYDSAHLGFVILNGPTPVKALVLKLPGNITVPLTGVELAPGEIVKYAGGDGHATIHTSQWGKRGTVEIDSNLMKVAKGPGDASLEWVGASDARIQLELRFIGPPWQLQPGK